MDPSIDGAVAPDSRSRALSVFVAACALLVLAATIGATVARLHLSLNFIDEPFYIALPYRFLLGDRMFVDEYNVLQLPQMLTYPLVALWVRLNGTQGIVLAMRYAFVAFELLIGGSVFLVFRRALTWPVALTAVLVVPAFMPWGIPALSYNTMGIGIFIVGLALGCAAEQGGRRSLAFAAGLAQGLSVVAYPTMVLPAAAYFLILAWRGGRTARLRWAAPYALGVTCVIVPLAVVVGSLGIPSIGEAYRRSSLVGGHFGGWRLVRIARFSVKSLRDYPFLVVALASVLVLKWTSIPLLRRCARVILLLAPLCLVPVAATWGNQVQSMGAIAQWALLGPLLFSIGDREAEEWSTLSHFVIPGLVAGAAYAATSRAEFLNAGIGLLAGALGTSFLLAYSVRRWFRDTPYDSHWWQLAAMLPLVLLTTVLIGLQFRGIYEDAPLAQLTHTVPSGPFRGVRTSERNADLAANLERDLRTFVSPDDRILFFDYFPAGYLFTPARPATDGIWSLAPSLGASVAGKDLLAYYRRTGVSPTVAVQINLWGQQYPPSHPLIEYLRQNGFKLRVSGPDYAVYTRDPQETR